MCWYTEGESEACHHCRFTVFHLKTSPCLVTHQVIRVVYTLASQFVHLTYCTLINKGIDSGEEVYMYVELDARVRVCMYICGSLADPPNSCQGLPAYH